MRYVNVRNKLEIDLAGLDEVERKFYRQALVKFRQDTPWLAFDSFAFGMLSPLYRGRTSHLEVLKSPLYRALKDMSLQLGLQQGMISKQNSGIGKETHERRQETGGRAAQNATDREKDRKLAAAR